MKYRTVLALPYGELSSEHMGVLQPVFEIRDGQTHLSDPADYPNRGFIFMPTEFDLLSERFPDGALVQLAVEVNSSSTVRPEEPNYLKYIVRKQGWREPERWAVQEIVNHPFGASTRTITMEHFPRHPVWVRDPASKRLYGPFDTTARKGPTGSVAVELQPPEEVPFAPAREKDTIAILAGPAVEDAIVDVENLEYIYFNHETFGKKKVEWLDFSTDESILEMIREVATTISPLSAGQVERLRTAFTAGAAPTAKYAKGRVERAVAVLDKVSAWQENRHLLIEEYLSTPRGTEVVDRYLEAHEDELTAVAFKKFHKNVLRHVEEHARKLTELAVAIADKQAEIDELRKVDTDALRAKREELEGDLTASREELVRLRLELEIGEDIQSLRQVQEREVASLALLESQLREAEKERAELQSVSEHLRKEAENDLNDLRGRLSSLKPYVDTLTGASLKVHDTASLPAPVITRQPPDTLGAYVDQAHRALLGANHNVNKKDVANVFTSILTSPLTILAGLPGVGKTSLVTRLAELLGMEPGSQFLTIRVPRGWRSRQDVLGYHNPITGEYERAPTGLYNMLEWHQTNEPHVPAWILFDEANLSAPEHYLSDFLGMMDEAADRTLTTGAPNETFQVPPHLRFIFTINHDHSVEALTPRVLDRAAVVYVPPPETFQSSMSGNPATAKLEEGTLSVGMLQKLMAAVPTELGGSEDAILSKVVRVLHDNNAAQGVPTRVSPRKYNRVLKHTTTLRHILGVNAGLDAIDHAVATHLLPLVRGSGKPYRVRLDALAREVENLPVSSGLLSRLIAAGEAAFDEYNFQTLA